MATTKEYKDFVLDQLSDLDDISAREKMPDALLEKPYEGAKEMLLVDRVDDRAFVTELVRAMYDELPEPKKKK